MDSTYSSPPPMLPGELTAQYMKRTGFHPPHWSVDEDMAFDAKVSEYEEAAGRCIDAKGRAAARRWLRRHGFVRRGGRGWE